jgi:hypothetical protein
MAALDLPALAEHGLAAFSHSHGSIIVDRAAITAIVAPRQPGFSLTEVWTGDMRFDVLETFEAAVRIWRPAAVANAPAKAVAP